MKNNHEMRMDMEKRKITVKEYDEIYSKELQGYIKSHEKFLSKEDMDCLAAYTKTRKNDQKAPFKIQYWKYDQNGKNVLCIKVQNYVGELELKNGLRIEILPKIYFGGSKDRTKKVYLDMLRGTRRLNEKALGQISLGEGKMHLFETYIQMYLDEAEKLIKRGLPSGYEEKTDNRSCFRGKLQIAGHIKQNIAHKERFYVTYEEFTRNRAENRLLKTVLTKIQKVTADNHNRRKTKTLLLFLDEIQESINWRQDLMQIKSDRNSRDYEKIMKWTEVILQGNSFLNFSDETLSRSVLFAMEEVFENYVACQIKKYFGKNWKVFAQDDRYSLFKYGEFRIRPDIVMEKREGGRKVILDTKWKNLPKKRQDFREKSRNDIYQMVTYASRYQVEDIWLIYPKAEYSYLYAGQRGRFETKIYGHPLVIHLFFIDLEDMEKSMEDFRKELESKEVSRYE